MGASHLNGLRRRYQPCYEAMPPGGTVMQLGLLFAHLSYCVVPSAADE